MYGSITLDISGLGIIMYSPAHAAHIAQDEDYFTANYWRESDVQRHIQKGTIVGFGTGSSGRFKLDFFEGYPTDARIEEAEFKYRLGLVVTGGKICIRDLYDLMRWSVACPESQILTLKDGIYHVTLCSDSPASGILGDDQRIEIYLQPMAEFPAIATTGIPSLV
ncbi:hypothetical protein DES53_1071 [Roseimicrobium gellanilyticum]|uniref:Uncharacterized protein n=1 Tax=Roseimicrobium gellanilyticum TaxID=748857 RepID=A0A366HF13_9BACT|nr:hypothetical protein [Roseimicrobium gellanilyticum]RBP41172.1 hypothetical protein DES53_1071 [Roseimicrobium gellanilyticum]